jgi:hypothetical protein
MINIDKGADGTRTAQGGYLDSGKCPAYRGFRGRRCRHDRQCGGGYRDREQRVLRAPATGQRVAKRVGYEGLRHANTVGNCDNVDAHPDRQHIHHGGTDAHAYANHADANANANHADAYPHHPDAHTHNTDAHTHANHADANAD